MGATTSIADTSFHQACREGDLKRVCELLPTMTSEQLNQSGPDGNTPLHCACEGNHEEIVAVLLDDRDMCSRTKLNRKGFTAYQTTDSERIRKRFHRPASSDDQRFLETNATSSLYPIPIAASHASIPDNWLRGHTTALDAVDGQFMISLSTAMRPLKKLIQVLTEGESRDSFESLIERCVANIPPTKREKIIEQYDEYKRTNSVRTLLTIYTSDTPIHGALQKETNAYAALLFLHLNELTSRAYLGETFRGSTMTPRDVEAYTWALHCQDYLLETRTLQSTSKDQTVAEFFLPAVSTADALAVLLTYRFSERCVTAIDLSQLSEFENEEEVLLLPFTLFKVESITIDPSNGRYDIVLIYVPLSKKSLLTSWIRLKN